MVHLIAATSYMCIVNDVNRVSVGKASCELDDEYFYFYSYYYVSAPSPFGADVCVTCQIPSRSPGGVPPPPPPPLPFTSGCVAILMKWSRFLIFFIRPALSSVRDDKL